MSIFNNLKNNIYFLKYVIQFSKSYVISQAFISIINGLTPLIYIIIPKLIIDELIIGNNFNFIIYYVIIYIAVQLLSSLVTSYLNEKYINLNGHLYSMHFLLLINKKIVSLDMAQLDLPETHQKIALAQDIIYKGIGIGLINNFFNALTSILIILSTSAIISVANINLLFIIIFFSVLSIFLSIKTENWYISQRDENVYLTRVLNYYIRVMGDKNNAKEMRLFKFSDWLMKKYYETLNQLKIRLEKIYSWSFKIKIISIIAENIKSNGIYLYLAWMAFRKSITIGEFTQYFSATGQLSNAIITFANFFTQLNINGKYIESFRAFMELESDIENTNNKNINKEYEQKFCDNESNNGKMQIRFENVSFSYPGTNYNILENINYKFEFGKVYVIVGENGAGKTTLINLISRLYEPTEGTIYLNDVPINEIDYREYRSNFSIVFQDFKYYAFTVAENVALNEYDEKDKSNEDKINSCLKKAGLFEKIKLLHSGIHTNLDKVFYDDGIILSGGENQKLALARALFRDSNVIILDEPSSALDPVSEDELLNSFKDLSLNKMVIYISHRLTCASSADEIIFIKNKTIHENGSHKDLINKNYDYAKYYNTQAKHYTN